MHKIRQTIVLFLSAVCISTIAQKPKLYPVQVGSGFTRPTDIKHCNDNRLFIVNKPGTISIMSKSGTVNADFFLDITSKVLSTGNEQGLLGLAFSPNYKMDGYFFVNYITGAGNGSTVIARYSVDPADSNKALANSELILLQFVQPYTNHNGGNMMFGKDGYLYISQGDGGSAGDPNNNAQNKNVYLGKLLRIDPLKGTTYSIPIDNPFVGQANVKEEIWAYGLRNPWRASFDRIKNDLWIGDVGQNLYEEVDFQPASSAGGENYGWRCYEAIYNFNTAGCGPLSNYVSPVFNYGHSTQNGCSITGGYVYRGAQYEQMFGRHFFTDFCSGRILSIRHTTPTTFVTDTLGSFAKSDYSCFGEDDLGELYLAGNSSGKIWHLTDTSSCNPVAFFTLSDTLSSCGATLNLQALYGNNLTYQWKLDGNDLIGSTDSSLVANATGNYSLVVNKGTCFTISKTTYVELNACTGMDGQIKNSPFTIYPNPNNGDFDITLKDLNIKEKLTIIVFDHIGRMIDRKNNVNTSKIEFRGMNLPAGVYFVEIKSENGIAVNKFAVTR